MKTNRIQMTLNESPPIIWEYIERAVNEDDAIFLLGVIKGAILAGQERQKAVEHGQ